MRALLDANVLYPTVLRQVLIGAAARGLYRPLWSARILEEWARAMARDGAEAEALARGEIAALRAAFPGAELPAAPGVEARLWLPDPADRHVLAVAIAGSADVIVTFNAADFPRKTLSEEGVLRMDPDEFLRSLLPQAMSALSEVAETARQQISAASGEDWDLRRLMKRAGLPRLGKLLAARG